MLSQVEIDARTEVYLEVAAHLELGNLVFETKEECEQATIIAARIRKQLEAWLKTIT